MGVGAAVVVRNARGEVLMVQRSAHQFGAGKWCFPCGYVEWQEDIRAAAAREAREEAGVEVVVGEPVYVETNLHQPEKPTVGIWFAATLIDPNATPSPGDDAIAVDWFDLQRPPPLAFPTDASLLAKLARG
jgi:ADP-ribose pyrophosphatase YjhB (NUDIX family)